MPDLTRQRVEGWVRDLITQGYAPDSVRLAVAALRGALTAAERAGVVTQRPADRIGLPRPRRRDLVVLTPGDVERICAAMPCSQDRLVVLLAAYCGLRAGEIAGLTVGRIDLAGRCVTVAESVGDVDGTLVRRGTKTGRVRSVPIPETVASPLAAHLSTRPTDPDAPLMATADGGPWRYGSWYRHRFRPAVGAIDRPELRFHDLRHTYASWLKMSDVALDASFGMVRDRRPPGPSCPLCGSVLATAR